MLVYNNSIVFLALLLSCLCMMTTAKFDTDQHELCEFWAKSDECTKNPTYMLDNCAVSCAKFGKPSAPVEIQGSFYDIVEKDAHGQDVHFNKFRGKVVLVVNVASYCGYTAENYALFRSLKQYIPWGLEIVIAPCNQFGAQEPGTAAEIIDFAHQQQFEGTVLSRADVNGARTRSSFQFLKQFRGNRDISWNFDGKFLVDRTGNVFLPGQVNPNRRVVDIESDIRELLEAPPL